MLRWRWEALGETKLTGHTGTFRFTLSHKLVITHDALLSLLSIHPIVAMLNVFEKMVHVQPSAQLIDLFTSICKFPSDTIDLVVQIIQHLDLDSQLVSNRLPQLFLPLQYRRKLR